MRRFLPSLALHAALGLGTAAIASACGGAVTSPAGAGPDSGGVPVDGSTLPADAGGGTCTNLTLTGGPTVVTDGSGASAQLESLSASAVGALVAWRSNASLPSGIPIPVLLREIGPDAAPLDAAYQALATLGEPASVAVGGPYTFAGVIAPDQAASCKFVPVLPSGSPISAPSSSPGSLCGSLRVRTAGFDWLSADSTNGTLSLVTSDPAGRVSATVALDAPQGVPAVMTRASFEDGSFLLATTPVLLSNCVCPTVITVRHYDASGKALSAGRTAGMSWPESRFALVAVGDGALLVGATSNAGALTAQPLDADGNAAGAAFALGGVTGTNSVMSVDASQVRPSVAVVAWVESTATTTAHVVTQLASHAGVLGAPKTISADAIGHDVRVAGIPSGAVVAWDGPLSGDTTVHVASLGCGP